jgi:hypothetical protein
MSKKSKLGQFYTTNYEYIFQNMYIPIEVKKIIEPFAGNCDLIKFIKNPENYKIELYDIDTNNNKIIKQDTLNNPPDYNNKFIITNPPYLARNKNEDKLLYDKYNTNDLYKCFIISIIKNNCIGGIIIIPLNFISSIRKNDIELRKQFLEKYNIQIINIFEEKVFKDTSYSVCSIQFKLKIKDELNKINCNIYPENKKIEFNLNSENNYIIGGEIYKLPINKNYIIERATKNTKYNDCITNILLKSIDDNIKNQIKLKLVKDEEIYIDNSDNLTARSYASLVIIPKISLEKQKELIEKFNEFLEINRIKYNSLFLTNYRESNSIARKRISFDLAFKICNYLL